MNGLAGGYSQILINGRPIFSPLTVLYGLEQIPLKKISNAKMINLIGDEISDYRKISKLNDNEFFFDYLKKEIKEKRKMGHLSTLI